MNPQSAKQNQQQNLVWALIDRIKKLKICVAEHGYCQSEFKDFMAEIMSKIFTKGQTKIILQSDNIVKSMLTYCGKKQEAQQKLIFELLSEIQEKISHLQQPDQGSNKQKKEQEQALKVETSKVSRQEEIDLPLLNTKTVVNEDSNQRRRKHHREVLQHLAQKRRQMRELKRDFLIGSRYLKF